MQVPTTTKEAAVFTAPNTDTLQGRQLDGLLRGGRRGRMLLTVDIRNADGGTYHQTYRAKAWDGREGRMLTLDLNDGDWAAGVYPTKVLHVDTTAGTIRPAKGMADKALLYAGEAALRWAFTGQAPTPGNGTVEVTAAAQCGACGMELTHPTSKELGIGPECAKRLGLDHHYKGTTLTGRAKRKSNSSTAALALPSSPHAEVLAAEAATPQQAVGDGYMADPATMSDEQLAAWVRNFSAQPPSLDNMVEHGWAMRTLAEHDRRTKDADIFGAPVDGLEQVTMNALRQAKRDMALTEQRREAALRRHDYDAAQQYEDQLDTYRGMASKYQRDLAAAGLEVPA